MGHTADIPRTIDGECVLAIKRIIMGRHGGRPYKLVLCRGRRGGRPYKRLHYAVGQATAPA